MKIMCTSVGHQNIDLASSICSYFSHGLFPHNYQQLDPCGTPEYLQQFGSWEPKNICIIVIVYTQMKHCS